jgi:alkanesulfonate monooxygenase SsuD/methylene tetrahydromethanopterin reductase-like flavin-dependent oxidoreductase (luciferase family)
MRHGICVPNLGEFADPRQVADLARRAEDVGWDGFLSGITWSSRTAARMTSWTPGCC